MKAIGDINWDVSEGHVPYPEALARMEARQAAIHEGSARELVWLLEHPPLYTGGTSADPAELLSQQFPVYDTGRGGRYTYHGPGQRVGYVMIDLAKRCKDVRCYVHSIEGWVIDALSRFGVEARRAEGRIGIWLRYANSRWARAACALKSSNDSASSADIVWEPCSDRAGCLLRTS